MGISLCSKDQFIKTTDCLNVFFVFISFATKKSNANRKSKRCSIETKNELTESEWKKKRSFQWYFLKQTIWSLFMDYGRTLKRTLDNDVAVAPKMVSLQKPFGENFYTWDRKKEMLYKLTFTIQWKLREPLFAKPSKRSCTYIECMCADGRAQYGKYVKFPLQIEHTWLAVCGICG